MTKEHIKKSEDNQAGEKMLVIPITKDYISKSFQKMCRQIINSPIKIWPKDINRQSTEKKGKMFNKYMKLCELEIQIETKTRHHF